MTKYTLLWHDVGEIFGMDMTYPDILKYCKENQMYMVGFETEPNEDGDIFAYVEYNPTIIRKDGILHSTR